MTQKNNLFKGRKKKPAVANRHGKDIRVRKGNVFKPPKKLTKESNSNEEVTKFINQANEVKAAAAAARDGAMLRLTKPADGSTADAAAAGSSGSYAPGSKKMKGIRVKGKVRVQKKK
eukprot:TRINITY_DN1420_c0_g1_i1.p1 TRINITY_DN1420_c0_g1~~TRINITY_DN1420_c0_g1_i1.p1  ORF type:complete len:117 (-),score=38.22 TRINITY_DN1420_c0_g1_i1:380-730(-)